MIQINNLELTHMKDLRILLTEFNLVINKNDKIAIIGEEGNGKSTLLKYIYNRETIVDYIVVKGNLIIKDETIGYLPQELDENNLNLSVYNYLLNNNFFDYGYDEQMKLAIKLDFPFDLFYSSNLIKTLSGGEKVKLQLILLLISKPSVLLLDEPSNDLDIDSLIVLEKVIKEFDGAVLFISHDEVLIQNCANRIVHIKSLRRKTKAIYTIYNGSYDEYINKLDNDIASQNRKAKFDMKQKKLRDEKLDRIYKSVDYALNTISRSNPSEAKNLKDKMRSVKSMEKRFSKEDENMTKFAENEEAINLKEIVKRTPLPKNKVVLDLHLDKLIVDNKILSNNIDLVVVGNEHIGIIGNNGVGKSTLLKYIYSNLKQRKDLKVGYIPQNYEDELDLSQSLIEYLSISNDKDYLSKMRTFLAALKFTYEEMEHKISQLSGGQKVKALILKLLLNDYNVLILDEPTRNLSPLSNPVFRDLLRKFDGMIISISHDRKYLDEVVDKLYKLDVSGLKEVSKEILFESN